ncbi:hypothetical protein [Burkholderia contaminans]|uniref:hypothetical protein n=1 Tax=Burkholderia contaminans TaxID=488447 RepID=UPI00158992CF|nr:hypothetical protein [Burkholderia contaminans]
MNKEGGKKAMQLHFNGEEQIKLKEQIRLAAFKKRMTQQEYMREAARVQVEKDLSQQDQESIK